MRQCFFNQSNVCILAQLIQYFKIILGHYYYVNLASLTSSGSKGRLMSQIFPATQGRCLQFYRHMSGAGVGTLNIYIKEDSGHHYSDRTHRVWSQSGNQGDSWIESQAPIRSTKTFRVSMVKLYYIYCISGG